MWEIIGIIIMVTCAIFSRLLIVSYLVVIYVASDSINIEKLLNSLRYKHM